MFKEPNQDQQPLTKTCKTRKGILTIYIGSSGGGVLDSLSLAPALSKCMQTDVLLANRFPYLKEISSLIKEGRVITVDTHQKSLMSFILATFFSPNFLKFLCVASDRRYKGVLVIMSHPWASIAIVVLRLIRPNLKTLYIAHNYFGFISASSWVINVFHNMLEFTACIFASRIVTFSSNVGIRLGQQIPMLKEKIIFLRHCPYVPFETLPKDATRYNEEDKFVFSFVGRILPYKGVNIFLEAADIVFKSLSHKNVKFIVAGQGKIDYRIDQSKMEQGYVSVMNWWLDDIQIENVIKESSAIILPYTEASQSGVVSLSMSMGVPVIASDIGGLNEQIVHLKNGLLVPPSDPKSLADLLLSIVHGKFDLSTLKITHDNDGWMENGMKIAKFFETVN